MEVGGFVAGSVLGWSGGRTTREVEGAKKMLAFLRVTQSAFQTFLHVALKDVWGRGYRSNVLGAFYLETLIPRRRVASTTTKKNRRLSG